MWGMVGVPNWCAAAFASQKLLGHAPTVWPAGVTTFGAAGARASSAIGENSMAIVRSLMPTAMTSRHVMSMASLTKAADWRRLSSAGARLGSDGRLDDVEARDDVDDDEESSETIAKASSGETTANSPDRSRDWILSMFDCIELARCVSRTARLRFNSICWASESIVLSSPT